MGAQWPWTASTTLIKARSGFDSLSGLALGEIFYSWRGVGRKEETAHSQNVQIPCHGEEKVILIPRQQRRGKFHRDSNPGQLNEKFDPDHTGKSLFDYLLGH